MSQAHLSPMDRDWGMETSLKERLAGRKQMSSSTCLHANFALRVRREVQRTATSRTLLNVLTTVDVCVFIGVGVGSHRQPGMQSTCRFCQLQHLSYFIFF